VHPWTQPCGKTWGAAVSTAGGGLWRTLCSGCASHANCGGGMVLAFLSVEGSDWHHTIRFLIMGSFGACLRVLQAHFLKFSVGGLRVPQQGRPAGAGPAGLP